MTVGQGDSDGDAAGEMEYAGAEAGNMEYIIILIKIYISIVHKYIMHVDY